jgi:hypothetical protein
MADSGIQYLEPGGVISRGGKKENRGESGGLIGGSGRPLGLGTCRREWSHGRVHSREVGGEVKEGDHRWGPPVGQRKGKEKGRERRGLRVVVGWAGLLGCWPRAGLVGLLPFFHIFSFPFSVL